MLPPRHPGLPPAPPAKAFLCTGICTWGGECEEAPQAGDLSVGCCRVGVGGSCFLFTTTGKGGRIKVTCDTRCSCLTLGGGWVGRRSPEDEGSRWRIPQCHPESTQGPSPCCVSLHPVQKCQATALPFPSPHLQSHPLSRSQPRGGSTAALAILTLIILIIAARPAGRVAASLPARSQAAAFTPAPLSWRVQAAACILILL